MKVEHPDVSENTETVAIMQTFDGTLSRMNFELTNDGPMPPGFDKVNLSIDG